MTEDTTDTTTEPEERAIGSTASSTYKVLGEVDADDGAGVLGRNTADSGTPIGVEGAVPNDATGYGPSTPHDARVGGTAELGGLAGSITGGQTITDLLGDGLTVSSGSLSADSARPDLDDGSTSLANADAVTFGTGLTVTDDGDGTATVRLDRDLLWLEFDKLENDLPDKEFGWAAGLDADGSTALVGQPNEVGFSNAGKTVAFVETESGWSKRSAFDGSNTDPEDRFGHAVDLSADGTTGVVGAPQYNTERGYVDVVDGKSDWGSPTVLQNYGYSDPYLHGYSTALSDDGEIAFVGLPGYPDVNEQEGAAYVYDSGGSWPGTTRTTTLTASNPSTGARLGFSAAVDGDGTTAFLGAPYEVPITLDGSFVGDTTAPGELYVFDGTGGWGSVSSETAVLTPGDSSNEDEFGRSVAASTDGTLALVGAPGDDSGTGAAYVFDGSGGWGSATEVTKLTASDGSSGDRLGESVALDGAGTTAIVGASRDDSDAGAAYYFDGSGGWSSVSTETQKITSRDLASSDRFGQSAAIGRDSPTGLIGASKEDGNGAAYAFYGTE